MTIQLKKMQPRIAPPAQADLVHRICGCKWSLTVFAMLDQGINRPGEMVRAVDGLTTKVLNECLRRNIEYGLISKRTFPEVPPRVEYAITGYGARFRRVLQEIEALGPPPVSRD